MAANWKMIVASAAVLAGSIVGAAGLTAWWMRPPLPQPPILSPATVQASVPPLPTPPTGDQKPLLPKDPLGVGAKVVVLTEGATVHLAVDELAFREMPAGVTTKTLEMIGEGRLRLITDEDRAAEGLRDGHGWADQERLRLDREAVCDADRGPGLTRFSASVTRRVTQGGDFSSGSRRNTNEKPQGNMMLPWGPLLKLAGGSAYESAALTN